MTPEGRERIQEAAESEEVVDVDTSQVRRIPTNSARGAAFKQHVLKLLRALYPDYTWYHQGIHKRDERGLDLIGSRLGDVRGESRTIGVQVKFHSANSAPSEREWLSFLAGCFGRRVDHAMFVTTGRLTGSQRREAGEARVAVIEGREELDRLTQLRGVQPFDLYGDETDSVAED